MSASRRDQIIRIANMQFNYFVKNQEGQNQVGVIDAQSRRSAIEALQSRGLVILQLESLEAAPIFSRQIKIFQHVSQKELVNFSRQLSILFSAQVPMLESLHALAQQTTNSYFHQILVEVTSDVEGGLILSKAFGRHPDVFSVFFVNMIKSGEASGGLENALLYLADYLEKQYYLITKVRGAMYYPAFITGAFFLIGAAMMILVVPQLTDFLKEAGQELPFMTKVLIATTNFLREWWWFLFILIFGGAGYLFYAVRHSPYVREKWHSFILVIPIFGKQVLRKLYLTRFAENLSTLIQGGLTILQALQVSSDVVGNVVYQNIILSAKEEVKIGNQLSDALAKHPLIPPLVCQMVATGEKTGSIDTILKKMAAFYSKEVDTTVDSLSSLIEPILILLIGGAVAVLVASILLPIYSSVSSL